MASATAIPAGTPDDDAPASGVRSRNTMIAMRSEARARIATDVVAGSKAEPIVLLDGRPPLGSAQSSAVDSATHNAMTNDQRRGGNPPAPDRAVDDAMLVIGCAQAVLLP